MQAAVLAGGEGRRMRALSSGPKGLLPLGGKPILARQLEWLAGAGVRDVTLCLGYGADAIRDYCGDGARWGVRLDYRVETVPRGTAGAVADLGDRVRGDLLIVYGDLYVAMDCARLLAFHASHSACATLVVRRTDHPHDSDLVVTDPDGRVRAFGRLGSGKVSGDLACAAIWVARPSMLRLVPADRPTDFARDIFPKALEAGETLMAYLTDEPVLDVGTPERYAACEKRLERP
jgi:NDP-sugar pyrophosphorylase family protein